MQNSENMGPVLNVLPRIDTVKRPRNFFPRGFRFGCPSLSALTFPVDYMGSRVEKQNYSANNVFYLELQRSKTFFEPVC